MSQKISELLPVGTKLRAEYEGEYYTAEVLQVSDAKKKAKAPVKVSYLGHDSEAWVSLDQLKGKALKGLKTDSGKEEKKEDKKAGKKEDKKAAKKDDKKDDKKAEEPVKVDLPVGTKLQAQYEGKFYAAEIVQLASKGKKAKGKNPYKVHFTGQSDDTDVWVGLEDLKSKLIPKAAKAKAAEPEAKGAKAAAAATPAVTYDFSALEKGQRVEAKYAADDDGKFYAAEVLEVSKQKKRAKAPIKVHYLKYEKEDDSWLAPEQVQSKFIKKVKAAPAPKEKAEPKGKDAKGKDAKGKDAKDTKGTKAQADTVVTYLGSKPADVKALKQMAQKGGRGKKGKVVLSEESKLVLDGDVVVKNLTLDGTLIVRAKKTSKAIIQNLTVKNDGTPEERVVEAGTVAISNSFTSVVECSEKRPYALIGEPKVYKAKEFTFSGSNEKDVAKLEKQVKRDSRGKGVVKLTPSSTLVLKGNVKVRNLELDGTLHVEAKRGAQAIVQNLTVKNDGKPDERVVDAGTVSISNSFTSVVRCNKRRPMALHGA
jgi:histone H1/5